jgi:hypothetical protein
MAVQFAGSRSLDDRRRRRIAVAGDGVPTDDELNGGVAFRERTTDPPSVSPWLPRGRWGRVALVTVFWLGLVAVAAILVQPLPPHPQLAPAVEHLAGGPRPVLATYTTIMLWSLAAQFAAIIGWYRSHSQLDFQGKYRGWAWVTLVCLAWGFVSGTEVHTAIAAVAGPRLRWPVWRSETVVWLVPTVLAGLSMLWMVRSELAAHRSSRILSRTATGLLLLLGLGWLYLPELSERVPMSGILTTLELLGVGAVVTTLWCQALYVVYVSADPPEPAERTPWMPVLLARCGAISSAVRGWLVWPKWASFRFSSADNKPKRRRKKSEEEADAEEAPAARRRKKPATTRSRKAAKPRPKTKVEDEEPEYEDEGSDSGEMEDEWNGSDSADVNDEDLSEEDLEALTAPEPPARSGRSGNAKPAAPSRTPSAPPKSQQRPQDVRDDDGSDDDDDDEDDDDRSQYRVDSGHAGADPYKGLSKRQRRELKKQQRQGRDRD